jgi:hypothetical protein
MLRETGWLLAFALFSCRSATQYRLVVENDAPCTAGSAVTIKSGPTLESLQNAPEVARSAACGGASDDLVFVPNGGKDSSFAIEIASGDIVQRWVLAYAPHETRTFSTRLVPACAGIACKSGETCVEGPLCVSSRVEGDVPSRDGSVPQSDSPMADTSVTDSAMDVAPEVVAPAPVTVRMINGGTLSNFGSLDVCVKDAAGTLGPPLLGSRGKSPLGAWGVSASIPIPEDTGDVVSLVLAISDPPDCASPDKTKKTSAMRPPPGGQLIVFRKDGFTSVAVPTTTPKPTDQVVVRALHVAARVYGDTLEFRPRIDGIDTTPKVFEAVAGGAPSAIFEAAGSLNLVSVRSGSGFYRDTGIISPLVAKHVYLAIAMAESDPGTDSRVVVCDEYLADSDLRALCFP